MTQKQQDAIDNIMDYFKFEQVRKVMEVLNWEWAASDEGIPTVPELRQEARRLLKMAFEENYSYFVDIRTDTTPNEILGFDYTIKSWKFPPMYFDFFKDKREGNIAVIKKMIEMVKKEKQKEILIDLMNLDNDDKDK